ncbi:succinate dehydrogenase-like protein membrane anchor subunit [Rhizodiscina lignyota]|uniref:Succinate dehydrogenase [ubiquinone] cytochrome b small subunit n=1 Tax=Rhizodiscina lignyota TaxID=1504668 RepID=A0A9P4IL85_9PEZI|nr:succinate dehydrogenase-like protein membrane anchor subunit [Rhizodiscina lignyota]
MASIARPMLLRQCCNASAARAALRPSTFRSITPLARQPLKSQFVRDTLPISSRVAAFHAEGRKAILPPLPQRVEGTTNDPVHIPSPSPSHGSYHWTAERVIAAALIPLTVAPFAGASLNPVTDGILCALLVAHSHIGFQACIIDYFPTWRVPGVRKGLNWVLNISTVIVLIGLYEFETNDVGIVEAVKRVWKA